jgi:hypothetical protein
VSNSTDDGLCGIPSRFTTRDGLHLRCSFEMGHGGDHSWKKYQSQFTITAGVFRSDMIRWFHPVPKGCVCQPLRADNGEIVEYIFRPECEVHAVPRLQPIHHE